MSFRFARQVPIAVVGLVAAISVAACSSGRQSPETRSTPPPPSTGSVSPGAPGSGAAPTSQVQMQIEDGRRTFASQCARCHGAAGEGTLQGPAVIGGGALPSNPPPGRRVRTGAFRSAKDIGMFIKDNMPPGSSTPPAQTAGLLAFLLQSNGVMPSQRIDPAAAGSIPWNR